MIDKFWCNIFVQDSTTSAGQAGPSTVPTSLPAASVAADDPVKSDESQQKTEMTITDNDELWVLDEGPEDDSDCDTDDECMEDKMDVTDEDDWDELDTECAEASLL